MLSAAFRRTDVSAFRRRMLRVVGCGGVVDGVFGKRFRRPPHRIGVEVFGRRFPCAHTRRGRADAPPLFCRSCKPGSVPGPKSGPLSFIYGGSHLPSQATYPPASGEQPLVAGIHGLATHGTYCRATLLPPRWALTPPFHPYPPENGRYACGRFFSVTLAIPSRVSSR